MAIQIPPVQRFNPQAPQSVGRNDISVPNMAEANAPERQALDRLVDTGADYYINAQKAARKKELQAKDIKATDLQNQYELKYKAAQAQIGELKGDTTDYYKKLDDDSVQWQDEALSVAAEDPELAQMVQAKLTRSNGRLYESRTVQQTKQYYSYQNDVVNGNIKLRRDGAMSASTFLDVKNPGTFAPMMSEIDAIEHARAQQGEMNGFPVTYEEVNGVRRPVYAPAVEAQIKADVGDTVIPMVKSLNAAGKANEAKAVIAQYDRWLNAEDKAKLTSENDEASVKNRALDQLSKLGPNPTIDQINNLQGVGEDVKLKMREVNHTNSLHRERETNQKRDAIMSKEFQRVLGQQSSKKPYVTVAEYRDSAEFKNAVQYLSPQNVKTLEDMVIEPSQSDPAAMTQLMTAYQNDELLTLSPQEQLKIRSKLAGRDRTTFDSMLRESSRPNSDSRKSALIGDVFSEIDRQFDAASDPENPEKKLFTKSRRSGKYTFEDETAKNLLKDKYNKKVLNQPQARLKDFAEDIKNDMNRLAQEKAQRDRGSFFGVNLGGLGRFFNSFSDSVQGGRTSDSNTTIEKNQPAASQQNPTNTPQTPISTNKPSAKANSERQSSGDMATWTTSQWRKQFAKESGRSPRDVDELLAWKKKQLGN